MSSPKHWAPCKSGLRCTVCVTPTLTPLPPKTDGSGLTFQTADGVSVPWPSHQHGTGKLPDTEYGPPLCRLHICRSSWWSWQASMQLVGPPTRFHLLFALTSPPILFSNDMSCSAPAKRDHEWVGKVGSPLHKCFHFLTSPWVSGLAEWNWTHFIYDA